MGKFFQLKLYVVFALILVLGNLASCTSCHLINEPSEIAVSVSDPARIRFSGKGAGAGMMMSSSMGPMGIAIGVAIDEGIAKEIDENALSAGFSIQDIVSEAFRDSNADLSITINRYGFILARGDYPEDTVKAELILEVQKDNAETITLSYPKDIAEVELPVWPLESVKTDPQLVVEAFTSAARQLALPLP